MPSHLISAWNCFALYCDPQFMPQTEAQSDGLAEAAHVGPDALPDRLQRRPAVALLRHVPADDVRYTVVDGPEEPAPALRFRPRTVPRPCPRARPAVRSGSAHCGSGLRGDVPCRTGASSPCALISRSTRFLPARIPLAASRTLTFRWPSPRNGLSDSTVRDLSG